jgi:hypothetical protein
MRLSCGGKVIWHYAAFTLRLAAGAGATAADASTTLAASTSNRMGKIFTVDLIAY